MLSGDRDSLNYFLIGKAILIQEYASPVRFEWNKMKDFCDT